MRIPRSQHEPAQAPDRFMLHDDAHQPFAQSPAPVSLIDKYISQVGKRGAIGDQPGKADLPVARIKPETKRSLYRSLYRFIRNISSPVRCSQVLMDKGDIEPRPVCADGSFAVI